MIRVLPRKSIKKLAEEFSDHFRYNSKYCKLFCIHCNKNYNFSCKNDVLKHLSTRIHVLRVQIQQNKEVESKKKLGSKLIEGFVSAGIPLNNVRKPPINKVLKEISPNLPSLSSLRNKVLESFNDHLALIRAKFSRKPIFLIIDETQKKGKNIYVFCVVLWIILLKNILFT